MYDYFGNRRYVIKHPKVTFYRFYNQMGGLICVRLGAVDMKKWIKISKIQYWFDLKGQELISYWTQKQQWHLKVCFRTFIQTHKPSGARRSNSSTLNILDRPLSEVCGLQWSKFEGLEREWRRHPLFWFWKSNATQRLLHRTAFSQQFEPEAAQVPGHWCWRAGGKVWPASRKCYVSGFDVATLGLGTQNAAGRSWVTLYVSPSLTHINAHAPSLP